MNYVTKYVKDVANRLAEAEKDDLFGLKGSMERVRNQEGLTHTYSRLLQMAEQYALTDPTRAKDPAIAMATFSRKQKEGQMGTYSATGSNLGVSGAANLRTMDAMDISIAVAAYSLIPYLAIERTMTDSATNISYQDIIAENAHGNLDAGEVVLGAFQAPNTNLSMGLPVKTLTGTNSESNPADVTINFGIALMPNTISVQLIQSSDVIANGIDSNGNIFFKGTASVNATVDYKKGVITAEDVPAGITINATANVDTTSDSTGDSILTVTTEYKNVLLVAKPQQMIFKDNQLKNAYLNKLNIQIAGTGLQMDYGEMAIGKLVSIYIEYVNRLVVADTIRAGQMTVVDETSKGKAEVTRDISAYLNAGAGTGFADTKNDYVKYFVIDLNQRCLDVTGRGITCLLVGSRATNILSSTPDFVKSADYDKINAMIGTYDGYPVVRHQLIDLIEPQTDDTAYVYGLYKDPTGSAAPVAFGEFLPVSLTNPVQNYNNPEQIARSLSSFCGTAICVAGLCHRGSIKFA